MGFLELIKAEKEMTELRAVPGAYGYKALQGRGVRADPAAGNKSDYPGRSRCSGRSDAGRGEGAGAATGSQLLRFTKAVLLLRRACAFTADEARFGNQFFQLLQVVLYFVLAPLAKRFAILSHDGAPFVRAVNHPLNISFCP